MMNQRGLTIPPSPAPNGILRRKDYAIDDASASVRRASRARLSSIHSVAAENSNHHHHDTSIYNETLRNQKRKFDETRKENLDLKLQIFYLQQEMGKFKESRRRSSGAYVPKQNLYYESENDSRGADNPLKESFDEVVSSMTEENDRLKDEIGASVAKQQHLEMQLRESKESLLNVSSELKTRKEHNNKLSKESTDFENKYKTTAEAKETLNRKLRDMSEKARRKEERHQNEYDKINNELQEVRAREIELESTHHDLRAKYQEEVQRVETSSKQLHEARAKISNLEDLLAARSEKLDGLTIKLDALKFDNNALRQENRTGHLEIEETKMELENLQKKLRESEEFGRKQASEVTHLQAELVRAVKQRDIEREARRKLSQKLLPSDMRGVSPGDHTITVQPPTLFTRVRKDLTTAVKVKDGEKAKNWRENILVEMESTLKQVYETQTRLELERSRFLTRYCRQLRCSKPPLLTNAKLAL